jgi:hypothetical protein
MRSFALGLSFTLVAMASAIPAAGDEGGEDIHLDYVAPAACPTSREFESLVRARTARARFAPDDDGKLRIFDVRIVDTGSSISGRVVVRRARGTEGTRDFRARACSDVADALALVVALAVDPSALTAPTPAAPPAATPAVDPSATPVAPAPSSAPLPPPPRGVNPPPPPGAPTPTIAAPSDASSERPPRRALAIGVDLAVSSGTVPNALLGVSPYVGWQSSAGSTVVPSVRLGFVHATSGAVSVNGGSASFEWTVGRIDGCATAWPARAARLSACAHVEVGALEATGAQIASPRSQARAWFGAGPLVRVEWTFAAPMFVEADLAAMFHATTDRFYFLPDTTAYQVPLLGLCGSAGVGVYFW